MSLLTDSFNTGLYAVTRSNADSTTGADGHTTPATTTTLQVAGSLQALTGRDLKDLKEGARADDYRWFFTETPMYTVDEGHDKQDVVAVPDEVQPSVIRMFRVSTVQWHGVISGHYRVKLEKVTVP